MPPQAQIERDTVDGLPVIASSKREAILAPYEMMYSDLVQSGAHDAFTGSREVTQEHINFEIAASGDDNDVHKNMGVAHGTLELGIVSKLLMDALPNKVGDHSTIYRGIEHVEFVHAVLAGDTVQVKYLVNSPYLDEKDRATVKITCTIFVVGDPQAVMTCTLIVGFVDTRLLTVGIRALKRARMKLRSRPDA